MAFLIRMDDNEESNCWEIMNDITVIGRDSSNTLIMQDPTVSRHHCQVEKTGSKYTVTDLDSQNGTFVNGKRIIEAGLRHGDEMLIGKFTVRFIDEEGSGQGETDSKRMLLKEEERHDVRVDIKKWYLTFKISKIEQTAFLEESYYLIGRDSDCDIQFGGWNIDKIHALLINRGFEVKLLNVSDKKPILVNGKKIPKKHIFTEDGVIKIGGNELFIYSKE